MIDNRTLNQGYLLPNEANKMKSEDLARLIASLEMLDLDVAAVIAALAGKASSSHTHEMAEILGLVSALAGKAAAIHSHNIGSLGGVSLGDAAANQLLGFNGSLWVPMSIGTVHLTNKLITNAKLRDSDPLTVIGRASASLGSPSDISATANDRLLARVGDALAFVQMTIGMVPDGLLTFAKLASSALANQAEAEAGASTVKLMTPLQTAQAIVAQGGGGLRVSTFKAGATFTKDAKAKFVLVQGVGGGGGGGSSGGSTNSTGGWGGVYSEALFAEANVGATVAVTIGGGGGAGSDGGQSSFGSLVTMPGGKGGVSSGGANPTRPAAPGAGSISGTAVYGFSSVEGSEQAGVTHSSSNVGTTPGMGSRYGIGGVANPGNSNGLAGSGFGAGGGGAQGSRTGASGTAGIVIVTEIF